LTNPVDNKLDVGRLRQQDVEEFARFVSAHQQLVLGLCQTLGLAPADCDDAAAETFAMAYRALPKFRAESQLSTWLYRIAYRTAVKVRKRYPKKPSTAELAELAADQHAGIVSAAVEQEETAAAVWHAVSELDPEQAAAVEFFYRRGMAVDEVARVMEKPVGTVKTLLFRARERLRHLLTPLEETL
jgi:RNA polymerase sigma-70 factor (ECF subfamily)